MVKRSRRRDFLCKDPFLSAERGKKIGRAGKREERGRRATKKLDEAIKEIYALP